MSGACAQVQKKSGAICTSPVPGLPSLALALRELPVMDASKTASLRCCSILQPNAKAALFFLYALPPSLPSYYYSRLPSKQNIYGRGHLFFLAPGAKCPSYTSGCLVLCTPHTRRLLTRRRRGNRKKKQVCYT